MFYNRPSASAARPKDAIVGTFGTVTGLPAGYGASINYAYSGTDTLGRTGDGNDLAVTLTAVPEARSWLLLSAVAILTLAATAFRQRTAVRST